MFQQWKTIFDILSSRETNMSKSTLKYRDPYALEARKRKGGPHVETKRQRAEALQRVELDAEIADAKIPLSQEDQSGIRVGTHKEKTHGKSDASF
jgi:hypothetical protein